MKITFIAPYNDISAYPIRILSAYIKEKGFKSQIIFLPTPEEDARTRPGDVFHYDNSVIEQIAQLCRSSNLAGISFYSGHFDRVSHLTQELKARLNIPIIWGGKHATYKPEDSLQFADMVCLGEGEEALAELMEKMARGEDYFDTHNFWFKKDGDLISNTVSFMIDDLDLIPFPDYSCEDHYIHIPDNGKKLVSLDSSLLEQFSKRHDSLGNNITYGTMMSRGCPYNCTYCQTFKHLYRRKKYARFRSNANLIAELSLVKERFDFFGAVFLFDDDLTTLPAARIQEFCRLYKEKVNLPFMTHGHLKDITEEKLGYLVEAGLRAIHVGIQTGSERTKKLYKRNIPDEVIIKGVYAINKFKDNLMPYYDFIIDNPYETSEDVLQSLKLLLKFPRPYGLKVFSLIFFPGSELYEKAKADKLLPPEEEIIRKDYLSFTFRAPKYLNCIFLLFKAGVPNFIIKFMINPRIIKLMDREPLIKLIIKVGTVVRQAHRKLTQVLALGEFPAQ